MHSVAANGEKVLKRIQELADFVESRISSKVCGISFRHPQHHGIDQGALGDDADAHEFFDSEMFELLVTSGPELVALVAEIFHPNPCLSWIAHHPGAPVVEYLQTSGEDVGLLDVNPIVGNQTVVACRILNLQIVQEEADSDEIAIHK